MKQSGTGSSALKGPGGQIPDTYKPGSSWADDIVEEAEKLHRRIFDDEKLSKEFREIFGVLNSENSNMRRGALKALLAFSVQNTKVSKTDVRSVCEDLRPTQPALRDSKGSREKTSKGSGQKDAKPSNKFLKQREAELRGLFPDFKTSGQDSEYAKMKKLLVKIYKDSGETIEGALPRTVDLLQKMPRKKQSST